ncbi:MAG: PmoA family protein [Candidatus Poribacteria bacterium]|nr:PmoA family protein [Candidatus Poribacteria bacterium]
MFALDAIDDGLRLAWNGQTLLNYHFQTAGQRTYWHPLRLPDSPPLTMNQPDDHVHHQGMWVAWKKVNGVNFWEQPKPGGDPTGFGRVVHQRMRDQSVDTEQAQFTAENAWIDWQDRTHLTETRQTTVFPPQSNHLVIDVSIQFQPHARDVTLDLNRGEPGGGGLFYSGLAIRFDNALTPGRLLDADGRTEPMDIFGQQSRWCGFAGVHAEDGGVYGATIVDHPSNPRHPTTWWVRNRDNYGILHPSPAYDEPFRLGQDDQLGFKYRVILHKGYVEPDLINQVSGI